MEIRIDNLAPSGSSIPDNGTDAAGRGYLSWAVGETATFNFRLPETYIAGTDLTIILEESTPGQTKVHNWSFEISRELDTAETVTEEFTSSGTANAMSEREVTLTTDAALNSVDLTYGDLISIVMSRVAASTNEDSNEIKTYGISIWIDTTDYGESGCMGRVGIMIDQVRTDFNDAQAKRISNTEIIRWFNQSVAEMAQANLFQKETALSVVADTGQINLLTTVSDYVDAFTCRWHDDRHFMKPASSWQEFKYLSMQTYVITSTPWLWFVQSNMLHFHPAYDSNLSDAIYMLHSYLPADLECSTNFTPEFPMSFDSLLVAHALYRAHSKFFPDTDSPQKAQEWFSLWQAGLARLKRQSMPAIVQLRPYR